MAGKGGGGPKVRASCEYCAEAMTHEQLCIAFKLGTVCREGVQREDFSLTGGHPLKKARNGGEGWGRGEEDGSSQTIGDRGL